MKRFSGTLTIPYRDQDVNLWGLKDFLRYPNDVNHWSLNDWDQRELTERYVGSKSRRLIKES